MRIAQEALANVRKHSQASQVVVTLEYQPESLCLRVDDDGRGIDATSQTPTSEAAGFGLASMRERARQAGGHLEISSRASGGTSVICQIPRLVTAPAMERMPSAPPRVAQEHSTIRVGIIDDHTVIREGLLRLLGNASGIDVNWQAPNAEIGLELIARATPDVLLLDLQMPGLGGLGCLERLSSSGTLPRTIVLTTFAQDELVYQAIRLGARGYLLKDASPDELLDAIRIVAGGGTMLAPAAAEQLAQRVNHPETLTPREREVLALLADGLRNKEIAHQLGTREKTVQFHIANLFGKLGVSSRTEATRVALERGLVPSRNV
jgi:DNA-binding NarL/FixJ family response regulator